MRPKVCKVFLFVLPFEPLTGQGSPTASINRSPLNCEPEPEGSDAGGSDASASKWHEQHEGNEQLDDTMNNSNDEVADDGDFGDDFDNFEEGGDGDDFGDFDDGFQSDGQAETTFDRTPHAPPAPIPSPGPVSQRYSIPLIFTASMSTYLWCDASGLKIGRAHV